MPSGALRRPLERKRVLIVEDEYLLALSLQDDLCEAGAEVIGPVSTVNEALEAVANVGFDVAVLDINLRGELSFPVADELLARDVPFLFLTGYGNDVLPERFRDLPSLGKPHDPKGIADLVARLSAST